MNCPICDKKTKVIHTAKSYGILRRRLCTNFDHRFSTREIPVKQHKTLIKHLKFLEENRLKIAELIKDCE